MNSAVKKIVSSLLALVLIFSAVQAVPFATFAVEDNIADTSADYVTVTFDPMRGTVYPQTKTGLKGIAMTLPRAYGRTGYEFLGWAKSAAATRPDYYPGESMYPTSDITLYAVWKEIIYTITLSSEPACSWGDKTYTVKGGEKFTFPDDFPTRSGYEFSHWEDTYGYSHQPGNSFTPLESQTIYAQWSSNSYFIRYYDNYATPRVTVQEFPDFSYATIDKEPTSRYGYDFLYWKILGSYNIEDRYYLGDSHRKNTSLSLEPVYGNAEYTYTFDSNGGEEATYTTSAYHNKRFNFINISTPTRTGYYFLGWSETKTATTADYTISSSIMPSSDKTFYAVWELLEYTVNYDCLGGEPGFESQKTTYDNPLCTPAESPVKSGYSFLGWAESATATKAEYLPEEEFYVTKSTTLYAVWKPDEYTVSFDANGGEGAPDSQIKYHGTDLALSDTIPTREGYTFLGWATYSTATEAQYKAEGTYSDNESLTLYAVWELSKYTVSFDANGGENAPESQIKAHGEDLTLSDISPTREGHTFLGWSESATATEADYNPGDTFIKNETTTLYAVWSINYYTLSFDANGGESTPDSVTAPYGTSITLGENIPAREGYTFLGWAENKAATEVDFASGNTFTLKKDIVLYAVWGLSKYTVSYNANGGENAPESQIKTYGEDLTLSDISPTREGHTFLGWAAQSTATEAEYTSGDTFVLNKNTTLYAVWSINKYTVSYDANGGESTPESQIKTYGEDLVLSDITPTREGYTFFGWSESDSATEADYNPGDTFIKNETIILYAVWELSKYTVSFDANGGENAPKSQNKTYGEDLTLSDITPTREGHTFLGWSESATATEADYNPGDTFIKNETTTLYAVWSINKYTVSYDANGGENAPESQTKIYDEDLTLSDITPTREGHTFLGWSESTTATEADYTPGDTFIKNETTTLYAVWSINKYTLNYDTNGGMGTPDSQTGLYNEKATLTYDCPIRPFHTFLGWSEDKSATEAEYKSGDTIKLTADTTLYAVWKPLTCTITYDSNGGWSTPSPQSAPYGTEITLSDAPLRPFYTFLGWAESKTATEAKYKGGDTFRVYGGITLYAVWVEEHLMGDVNLDGSVNIRDVTELQKHLASLVTLSELSLSLADFDQNGVVNIRDATAIQKFLAGLEY